MLIAFSKWNGCLSFQSLASKFEKEPKWRTFVKMSTNCSWYKIERRWMILDGLTIHLYVFSMFVEYKIKGYVEWICWHKIEGQVLDKGDEGCIEGRTTFVLYKSLEWMLCTRPLTRIWKNCASFLFSKKSKKCIRTNKSQ